MLRSKKTTCALVKNQIFVIGQFRPEMDPTHIFGLLVGIARFHLTIALIKDVYIMYIEKHCLRAYKAIASHQRGQSQKRSRTTPT